MIDLEEILKNAIVSTGASEAQARDIGVSEFAPRAEEIIEAVHAGSMSRNKRLGFEALTRAYAKEYGDCHDRPSLLETVA